MLEGLSVAAGVAYAAAAVFVVLGMTASAWVGLIIGGSVAALLTFAWFTK